MVKDIPHGHGASHKRGIIDSLEENKDYSGTETPNDLPNGHDESYRRGRNEGDTLRKEIAERVRPNIGCLALAQFTTIHENAWYGGG